eukprot:6166729-Pyramimonas_sp.AAC.1
MSCAPFSESCGPRSRSILPCPTHLFSVHQTWPSSLPGAELQSAASNEDHFTVESGPEDRKFVLRVKGLETLAARRAAQALGALKRPDGSWQKFATVDAQGYPTDVFLSADKSPAMVRAEIACKQVRQTLFQLCPTA